MNDPNGTDRHDLLDRALAAYGDVQPPAGLEARVLEAIQTTARRRRRCAWLFFGGPAVAAAAALFLLVNRSPDTSVPGERVRNVAPARVDGAPPVSASPAVSVAAPPEKPRQSTFPASSEPSEGERALLSLMSSMHSNEQGLMAFSEESPSVIKAIDPVSLNLKPVALAALFESVEQVGGSQQ